jgi:hypothetical protein
MDEAVHIHSAPSSKKRRVSFALSEDDNRAKKRRTATSAISLFTHPYGVKPLGNLYFSDVPECRSYGLGFFSLLEDDTVMAILSCVP